MECHEVTTRQTNTAGNPLKEWRCYCETTACLKGKIQNYHSVETVKFLKPETDCDCEYEWTLKGDGFCRICEKRFYDKVHKGSLL